MYLLWLLSNHSFTTIGTTCNDMDPVSTSYRSMLANIGRIVIFYLDWDHALMLHPVHLPLWKWAAFSRAVGVSIILSRIYINEGQAKCLAWALAKRVNKPGPWGPRRWIPLGGQIVTLNCCSLRDFGHILFSNERETREYTPPRRA